MQKKVKQFILQVTGNFRNLLILVFLLTLILFTFVCITCFTITHIKTVNENEYQSNRKQLVVYHSFYQNYLEQLKGSSLELRYNKDMMNILEHAEHMGSEEISKMRSYFVYRIISETDYREIEIYFPKTDMVYRLNRAGSMRNSKQSDYQKQSWYPKVTEEHAYMDVESVWEEGGKYAGLLYHRMIIDVTTKEALAMVTYRVRSDVLFEMFSDETGYILLFDEDGGLFFSSRNGVITERDSKQIWDSINERGDNLTINLEGTMYQVFGYGDEEWMFVRLIPMSVFRVLIYQNLRNIFLIGLAFIIFLIPLVIITVNSFTHPLHDFAEKINQMDAEVYKPIEIDTHYTDIQNLNEKFNALLYRIDHLYMEEYKAKLTAKEMQMKAMEAQIDSHFLYNTLQAISTKALQCKAYEVDEMINYLAKNFRYTIQHGDYVYLQEEIRFCQNYIYLQKLRFSNRLSVEFEIEKEIENIRIPKFMIQIPIENAIIHGMENAKNILHIQITGKKSGKHIFLDVIDDGSGIDPERLKKLQYSMQDMEFRKETPDRKNGMGLVNLCKRLYLLYDTPNAVKIDSNWHKGVHISIVLPDESEGRESNNENYDC